MSNEQNEQIVLASRPEGMPNEENFRYETVETNRPDEGQVLLKTLYLSVDPYMRGRMSDAKSYVAPFQIDEPLNGTVVAEVIESRSEQLEVGDKVTGFLEWKKFNVADGHTVRKIDDKIAPISAYLSVLGLTGLTAYFGLYDIGEPKEGETVVVSGAAGAVGTIAGQLAKLKGCRVVGIAGSDDKIDYIVNELGFDAGLNYKKSDNLQKELEEACPNGVDVYFDNVGGEISDAVMNLLNTHARIPLCGAISSYNRTDGDLGPRVQTKLIKTRAKIQGFVLNDYQDRFQEGTEFLAQYVQNDQLKYEETIVEGFESVTDAFFGLFQGTNLGKQLVKVADPS
ncbi:NADP-dependent oxidoreductase [Pontibacillus halophilus JSM 076056 = DSM 19796]|uniref:NADP-dependent oxidoreductase n=1 Tax=Pontibacillus halophilus JSM 076056 = DSM 19796 TaxID=1385510 RepID=A0A0A5GKE2_9BACI|nr:NADP-dependent oxidoreductase [Pontibacillus halophilus]KGX91625.1 NADP-dependent oxidoreductase [Pontibacillus halophilus JSM 076056 = DSM 19796]